MPRPERHLDPSDGPIAAFAADLRKLREAAGSPKYLQMARRTGRSRTALAEAAGGDHLPTWETVDAFVRACGGDPAQWVQRWEHAKDQLKGDQVKGAGSDVTVDAAIDSVITETGPEAVALPESTPSAPPTAERVPQEQHGNARKPGAEPNVRRVAALAAVGVLIIALGVVALTRLLQPAKSSGDVPAMRALAGKPGAATLSFARFTPNLLATADSAGVVRLWDTRTAQVTRVIDTHNPHSTVVAFDPLNRNVLATAAADGLVRVWDYTDGEAQITLSEAGSGTVTLLAFDPTNRNVLVTGGGERYVTMWDTSSGERIRSFDTGGPVTALAFDPLTRNTLATAGHAGTVTIWDASNGKRVRNLRGRLGRVTALAFDPLTRNTLATGETNGALRIWDSSNGQPVRAARNSPPVRAVAFNPNIRNSLASGNEDGTVRIWDSSTALPVHVLHDNPTKITSLAYATDGTTIAAGSEGGTVRLWKVEDWS